ncbi:methyltransferase domain-containing protein [Frigidibacter sp. RF13]|uniref:RsmB/NOP family class I SAM-dependent RNA methyltransferase n=1 Tax=Frigidibacter sp. RF13 TaxID=2997340 RepID=UPI00226FBD81|nr:transcription antitermination factor NusB [Frigidibacter sp. RF13]MCY1128307.1 methyltransferase domain-containing protein [Frigidibacter sp. RF13]
MVKNTRDEGRSARAAAVGLILGVTEGRLALSDQIAAGALGPLDGPGRARAQRLALATLRNLGPIDLILKVFIRKPPPAEVRAILRLAACELLAEGAAAHGVVHEAVALTRASGRKGESFSGLVNAVLRKVAALPPESLSSKPAQELPGWLRGRLMSAWSKAATQAMEAAHAKGAPLDLTPKDGDVAVLAARVGGLVLPTGSVRIEGSVQVSDMPGYATGDWWVQDAAAALPAKALGAGQGERVLDLCAAPGGKTMQLAAAGADVTALDLSAARMARLEENLARCGFTARTVVADALYWEPDEPFDAILLDAPCSATGTIRRHPDLPFVKDSAGLKEVFALQAALLDRALGWLAPGGRLLFATCSLLPEEGEKQIASALARHPDLSVDPAAIRLPGIEATWESAEGGLRLRPDYWTDRGGMDGFYLAMLRRS